MYNSTNLPLSFRKVWKKTIAKLIGIIIILLLVLVFLSISLLRNKDLIEIAALELAIIAGTFFVVFVGEFIYEYLYYRMYYYNFEEDEAEIKKGVISRATGHVRYDRIQNVFVDQDFWDRIFGLYDVHYETAGETSGFYSHVDGLTKENADKLTAFLAEKTKRRNKNLQSMGIQSASGTSDSSPEQGASNNIDSMNSNKEISSDIFKLSRAVIFVRFFYTVLIIALGSISLAGFSLNTFRGIKNQALNNPEINYLVFAVIFVIFSLGSLLYQYVWYKNFYFHFGRDKGEIRTKVIAQSISYVYYDRVQNINILQSILDRFFGLYRISIETAGEKSGRLLILCGYRGNDAQKIRDFLLEKVALFHGHKDSGL